MTQFAPSERTRFGVPLPRLHDYSRKNIMDAVHQSLRRMQTDYLDIVQFHFSPAREVLEHEGALRRSTTSSAPARCASWAVPPSCRTSPTT